MQANPNRRARRRACQQSRSGTIFGGDFEDSRDQAALEIVAGYMAAIDTLDPDDAGARSWYRARLADARIIAGPPPL